MGEHVNLKRRLHTAYIIIFSPNFVKTDFIFCKILEESSNLLKK